MIFRTGKTTTDKKQIDTALKSGNYTAVIIDSFSAEQKQDFINQVKLSANTYKDTLDRTVYYNPETGLTLSQNLKNELVYQIVDKNIQEKMGYILIENFKKLSVVELNEKQNQLNGKTNNNIGEYKMPQDNKKPNLIDSYNKNTTNKIVRLIEKNPHDWQQLIADNPMYSVSGKNPVTYKGVNAISLAITNADRNNTDNRFMTRKSVEKAGLEIKESAKAMQISYLRPREKDVNGEKKQIPMMVVGYVYSANDIQGIEPAPKDLSALSLSQEQLLEKSAIPVVRSNKQLRSEFNVEKNEIQIASKIFDKGGDGLISNYAVLAAKVAVEQNYAKDSKDMQVFKYQMSAALITQSVGAKFVLKGAIGDVKEKFNTEFLKDTKQGMKAVRSSAKIANFVAEGKSFEMTKDKNKVTDKPKEKPANEKANVGKPTKREKLDKQRNNANDKGRNSR